MRSVSQILVAALCMPSAFGRLNGQARRRDHLFVPHEHNVTADAINTNCITGFHLVNSAMDVVADLANGASIRFADFRATSMNIAVDAIDEVDWVSCRVNDVVQSEDFERPFTVVMELIDWVKVIGNTATCECEGFHFTADGNSVSLGNNTISFNVVQDLFQGIQGFIEDLAEPCEPCDEVTADQVEPSDSPSDVPSDMPTIVPSATPSSSPTANPTGIPSSTPTTPPTVSPTSSPTVSPSDMPSGAPSDIPSATPSSAPTSSPSASPSAAPTASPTDVPTSTPSDVPSSSPSDTPSSVPSVAPTSAPSSSPTVSPSEGPTGSPTKAPTTVPTASPSDMPSSVPSDSPSSVPSATPTSAPSSSPTESPSEGPTASPTKAPTTIPTASPSDMPSSAPSDSPSSVPSASPTSSPTTSPTASPTASPSDVPSSAPSDSPSSAPTDTPTALPTTSPTASPSGMPSDSPSSSPSDVPSSVPTASPTSTPSTPPTLGPTTSPTVTPCIESVSLIATNNTILQDLTTGDVIDLSTVDSSALSILVDPAVPVARIDFQWEENSVFQTTSQSMPAYLMGGKAGMTYFPVEYLSTPGVKSVLIDVFETEGSLLCRKFVTFTIIEYSGDSAVICADVKPDTSSQEERLIIIPPL